MLINFKVKNFRSFKEEIEFSMEASSSIEDYNQSHVRNLGEHRLLKSAILFGANASGKSNFIKALESLASCVVNPTHDVNELLRTNTFSGNSENICYTIDFIKNSKHFTYILEHNTNEIVFEKLTIGNEIFFERQEQSFACVPKRIEKETESIRKNQLLLFFAQARNINEAVEAFTWFNQDLVFANTTMRKTTASYSLFLNLKDEDFKAKFLAFLKYADFNITDVELLESQTETSTSIITYDGFEYVKSIAPYTSYIVTTHEGENGCTFKLALNDESEGTKNFILIALELLLANEKEGKVIIIDEFNGSFHLELSKGLLDLINREKQNNQFILTTHELSLMDHELRQDQIYFTEKNKNGLTDVFSLFDFDDPMLKRRDISYKKRYLNGRYGGVPIISSTIMKCILEEEDA